MGGGSTGEEGVNDNNLNLSKYDGDKQITVIGQGNNVNKQNFSTGDIANFSGGGGGRPGAGAGVTINIGGGGSGETDANAQGIAETYSIGGNYSNLFNDKKTEFNANAPKPIAVF